MMSLSPDECKWSERLAPRQRGSRCGFVSTCVDVCQRCKGIEWSILVHHPDLLENWPPWSEAGISVSVHLSHIQNTFIHAFPHWQQLNSSWPQSCESQRFVVVTISLTSLTPLPCYLIATTTVPALMSLFAFKAAQRGHMLSQACIMNTHTCRPTLTPLQMKGLRESRKRAQETRQSFWKVQVLYCRSLLTKKRSFRSTGGCWRYCILLSKYMAFYF